MTASILLAVLAGLLGLLMLGGGLLVILPPRWSIAVGALLLAALCLAVAYLPTVIVWVP